MTVFQSFGIQKSASLKINIKFLIEYELIFSQLKGQQCDIKTEFKGNKVIS
jgi:hypothetical protein